MVEFFELISSYWQKSKEDWDRNRHRLYTLFAFALIAYIGLEFGSYIFTSRLNHAHTVDEIRSKFIDHRVDLAEEFIRKFFILKETTRKLIIKSNKKSLSVSLCTKLQTDLKISELETDLFVSSSNLRYFFGDKIADEFVNFISWYDKNNNDCFKSIPQPEQTVDNKIHSIREKMWSKMYPPDIIGEIR